MDLHDDGERVRAAPAGALTAAEAAAGAGGRLLCAQCVGALAYPVYAVRVSGGPDLPPGAPEWRLGQALALVDAGHVLTDPEFGELAVYAVTTIRGTAVCAPHCYVVANEGGRGFPFRV